MNRVSILSLVALAACASGGAPAAAPLGTPAFAPSLAVDTTAMTRQGGVLARDLKLGDGPAVARGTLVAVRYAGWLANGTPIDSVGASEPPLRFRVGDHVAIAGWEAGVLGMRPGGRRQLVIPPRLGYGARGKGPVPANATLVFVIEVVGTR